MCSVGLVRVSHCVFEMCELMVSVPMFHPRVLERLACPVVVRASRKWIHVLRVQWMSDVLFLWLRDFRWLHILFFRRRVRDAVSAVDVFLLARDLAAQFRAPRVLVREVRHGSCGVADHD